jgi:hypothetical protein
MTTELVEAEKILGIGTNYDMKHALQCFEAARWVKEQNELFEEIETVKEARNLVCQTLVCKQKEKYRFFTIESPFEHTCPVCNGPGELYKFIKKTVQVNCHMCGKTGIIKHDCPTCKGTGRFIKKWKTGGGVNVECRRCEGKKKIEVKCEKCLGNGTLKKEVLTHTLKSTTPCKKCDQLGYIEPKPAPKFKPKAMKPKKQVDLPTPKKVQFSPLMSQSLADKIKKQIAAQ